MATSFILIKRHRMIFFTALLALQVLTTQAQTSTLPIQGWAKNSVNAVVFRRNSVVTDANIQYTAYYNSEGYVVLGKRVLGSTTWETKITSYKGNVVDAHNSISIMVDGQGYLHMSWNHHNTALNYCKSAAPHTLTMDAAIPMIGTKETAVSYPEFHRLPNGDLIFMYRDGSSGNGNMVINKYDHLQKKWQRVHSALINGEGLRNAYWQSFIDIKGTIHVSWVWRESSDVASNHDLCYAQSTDGGHTWKKSSGSMYVIPITAATAEYAARIPQNSDLINQTSMYGDSLGVPYICSYWKPAGTTTPQYHLVYLKNGLWHTQQISKRITPFSLSGSGTKKIPISRPQVLIGQVRDKIQAYVLYRDIEHGDRVSLLYTLDLTTGPWEQTQLTDYSTGSWEPSYDTELWKSLKRLHIFVQRVGQGDGETLEDLAPQDVTILEWQPEPLITRIDNSDDLQEPAAMIHPNPSAVSFMLQVREPSYVRVFDVLGRPMEDLGLVIHQQSFGYGYPKGIYVASIENGRTQRVYLLNKQ